MTASPLKADIVLRPFAALTGPSSARGGCLSIAGSVAELAANPERAAPRGRKILVARNFYPDGYKVELIELKPG